ncbi:MAG: PKD domain-containing protein [Planctomyces sp.]
MSSLCLILGLVALHAVGDSGLQRPEVEYSVFQFPADRIPRIDGDPEDWNIVPESYVIGTDQLRETVIGRDDHHDPEDLDVRVRVGWVKGLNHLYFLYEASDNYWDFSKNDLHNDIFEVVVDGDLSGGPLIRQMHPNLVLREGMKAHGRFHGVHAQNYHIFTPARDKDWAMVWGTQPWIKELPWANAAYRYNFQPGEKGKLVLEFFITPFDYAAPDPARSVASKLRENELIGMSWAILDYDDVNESTYRGFWNLSHKTTMYGDASDLVAFRLKPLETSVRPSLAADWSFQVVNETERQVAFRDQSFGKIAKWYWDFGDGESSEEQNPVHRFQKEGEFIVTLTVEESGPEPSESGDSKNKSGNPGLTDNAKRKASRTKVWDVTLP